MGKRSEGARRFGVFSGSARLALVGTALSAALSAAPRALADEPGKGVLPITVLAVQTLDADDQAEALTTALSNAVRASKGYSVGPGDYSLEVLTLSLKCAEPPDAPCLARIGDEIKTDRYLFGSIQAAEGDMVKGEVGLWTRGKGASKVPVHYSANLKEPLDASLQKIAEDAVGTLTGGPPKGALRVRSSAPGARVFIDGEPAGALEGGEGTFPVPAGRHRITVKAPGRADAEAEAEVEPNATEELTLSPAAPPEPPPKPLPWRKIAGFTGIGLGAVAAGIGIYGSARILALRGDANFTNAARTFSPNENTCDRVRAINQNPPSNLTYDPEDAVGVCDEAGTMEIVQFVAYPAAALLAGAGIYLVATDGASKPRTGKAGARAAGARARPLSVRPSFGPRHGGVDMSMRF